MLLRIFTAIVLIAIISAAVIGWRQETEPTLALAQRLQGERWYSLTLDDRHLGYWRTSNHRDEAGNWVFESEQRFAMNPLDPVALVTRRVFAAAAPHPLLTAHHEQRRRNFEQGIELRRNEQGYEVHRQGEAHGRLKDRAWHYNLADYLAFERWLQDEQPSSGAVRSVPTLDFERVDLVSRAFDVVERNGTGYVIENAAPLSATRIQLDDRFLPVTVNISGLFDLTLSSRAAALAPRSTLRAASYYIPADRRLPDHTRISRLVLGVQGDSAPAGLFETMVQSGQQWRLELSANPVTGGPVAAEHLAETVNLPSQHPEIAQLAAEVLDGLEDDLSKARALTRFVHQFLDYRPGTAPQGVLSLLVDRRGDCTEFADLLTTLARNAGLPSRTIFGLAYSDRENPAFAYHAWNELFVDGGWIAMDPTWGQDRVDATHIPLPADDTAALRLLTGSVDLAFTVLEVEHFGEG